MHEPLPPVLDSARWSPHRVLVIDDEQAMGEGIRRILQADGHNVRYIGDSQAGLQTALTGEYDVVFLDLTMPGLSGMEILRHLALSDVTSDVIVISGQSTVEIAVEAMKAGAADFISKPFLPNQLRLALQKVCERTALIRENAALRHELNVQQGLEGIIGESQVMQRVFALIQRVAPTDGTVLVTGESGTGKEMVVRAVHRLSRRKNFPLMACDCSALAPTLLESELFGHVKGSFSGAIATKQGLFEAAHRGTLFLDEISNLSMETQGKLLRVLETRKVRKVGDTAEKEYDIRLVTASNRDLGEMVREGVFREDLFYRLNVVPVYLPPLRQRPGDLPLIAVALLERCCKRLGVSVRGFTPEAMMLMENYSWPGNVRELRNIIERMAILCDGDRIEPQHLPMEIRQTPSRNLAGTLPRTWDEFKNLKRQVRDAAVEDLERRFVAEALKRCGGNISKTADEIGIQRTNLHALIRRYDLAAK